MELFVLQLGGVVMVNLVVGDEMEALVEELQALFFLGLGES